jgi:hypothetical protein
LHRQQLRFGRVDRGHLIQRRRRAVVINHHVIQDAHGGASGADGGDLAPVSRR